MFDIQNLTFDVFLQELAKQDGRISVPRSSNCRHAANAACIHCMAKEPFDAKYLEEQVCL